MNTRCPAPVQADMGVHRCVVRRDRCDYPGHRCWNRIAWPMAVLWRIKPWWPNAKGRAADRRQP